MKIKHELACFPRYACMGLVISLMLSSEGRPCSCGPITVEEAFSFSDVVFQGEVVASEMVEIEQLWGTISYYQVTFRVLRSWKGIDNPEVTAYSETATCGIYPFETGEQFLIYSEGEQDFDIYFHQCNSERLTEGWSEDIAILNSIAEPILFVDESELIHPPSMPSLCGSFGFPGGFAALILFPLASLRYLRRTSNGAAFGCFSKSAT